MFSNQQLAVNGAAITNMSLAPVRGEDLIAAQQGYLDSSILLTSFIELDPNRNMLMLQNKWDEQVMKRASFSNSIYQKVVNSNSVLTVNGQDGGFKYKMAVETDNCFRTVEDTSDQSPDGYVGGDGTSFRIVLNKKVAPFQTISVNKAFEDFLVVSEHPEPQYVGNGYEHYVTLLGSEDDKNKVYDASFLQADVTYEVTSNSYIAEYSEKLGIPHLPDTTNYIECEFKLGSGQGAEHWFTGKSDSYKLDAAYTTADTQRYLQELSNAGLEDTTLTLIQAQQGGRQITAAADILELITLRSFTERFNSALMFMHGGKRSTSKGTLEFNEGLWQQMRRGKIFRYNKKGGLTIADLAQIRNYVYMYNDSRIEDTFLEITAGSELYQNIEAIISQQALNQLNNIGFLLGAQRIMDSSPVTGTWDNMSIGKVKFSSAIIPGVGELRAVEDKTLDYITEKADVRTRGINPGGKDWTTYSGYIFDVTDQQFSNNGKLPEGTRAVGGEMRATKNVYMVRPEKNAIV